MVGSVDNNKFRLVAQLLGRLKLAGWLAGWLVGLVGSVSGRAWADSVVGLHSKAADSNCTGSKSIREQQATNPSTNHQLLTNQLTTRTKPTTTNPNQPNSSPTKPNQTNQHRSNNPIPNQTNSTAVNPLPRNQTNQPTTKPTRPDFARRRITALIGLVWWLVGAW